MLNFNSYLVDSKRPIEGDLVKVRVTEASLIADKDFENPSYIGTVVQNPMDPDVKLLGQKRAVEALVRSVRSKTERRDIWGLFKKHSAEAGMLIT